MNANKTIVDNQIWSTFTSDFNVAFISHRYIFSGAIFNGSHLKQGLPNFSAHDPLRYKSLGTPTFF